MTISDWITIAIFALTAFSCFLLPFSIMWNAKPETTESERNAMAETLKNETDNET